MKHTFLKTCSLFALALVLTAQVGAQVSHGGSPLLRNAKSPVAEIVAPVVDGDLLLRQDQEQASGGSPLRIGVMTDVSASNLTDGETVTLADGTRVWRLAVVSPKATFVSLHFDLFDIPEGARLFVYADGDFVLGGFTRQNRQPDGCFYTQNIPGDRCVVEYQEPASVAGMGRLHLSQVQHGYKDFFGLRNEAKGQLGNAGNCHYNVACPEGDAFRNQIRSVVEMAITLGKDTYLCSGALINTTANDKTPYILTAYHCQDGGVFKALVAYFNYQVADCNGTYYAGWNTQSVAGAEILAKNDIASGSDFALLRLNEMVPDSYRPYYAGWDRSTLGKLENPTKCAGIHHPAGDYKKISIPYTVTIQNGTLNISGTYANANRFFYVDWLKGITEQGSSGSPLFNKDGLVVGQLSAGSGDCGNPSQSKAYYGRLASDWTGGGTAEKRLSDWLDPLNTGTTALQGINYDEADTVNSVLMAHELHVYPNPSDGMIRFDVEEIGEASYRVYNLNGIVIYEGTTILATTTQALNLTFLPNGLYAIELYIEGKKYANVLSIYKQ